MNQLVKILVAFLFIATFPYISIAAPYSPYYTQRYQAYLGDANDTPLSANVFNNDRALLILLADPSVIDKDLTTSPVSPTNKDKYIVAGIGGSWSGCTINDIAIYDHSTWVCFTPLEGAEVNIEDEGTIGLKYRFNGTSWESKIEVTNMELGGETVSPVATDGVTTDVNISNQIEVKDGGLAIAKMADGDWGDFTITTNVAALDANSVGSDELSSTPVVAGSYTNADIVVDEDGRILGASNGSSSSSSTSQSSEISVTQTAHGFTVGQPIYRGTGAYFLSDADSIYEVSGLVKSSPLTDSFDLVLSGYISGLSGLVDGTDYYLNDVAGSITNDPDCDLDIGDVLVPIGRAISSTELFVNIERPSYITSVDCTPVFAPQLSSSTIDSTGLALALAFTQSVTQGAGYNNTDWDIDCDVSGADVALTYASGNTTATHNYTIASAIAAGEVCNIDFNGAANSEENSSGIDLAAIVSGTVVNNSAYCATPNNGDVLDEGFLGANDGYDNTSWTESGTGTINQDATLSGSPPSSSCSEGLNIVASETTSSSTWDNGSSIAAATNIDIICEIYVDSVALDVSGAVNIIHWDNDTSTSNYGPGLVQVYNYAGVYALRGVGASNATIIPITVDTWLTVKMHLDTTDSSSYLQCTSGCSDSTEHSFIRRDTDGRYFRLGPADALLGSGESLDIEYGYCYVNTP